MAELEVQVLSPAKAVFRGKATQVQAPGFLGRMGVLPGHAAMVAELGEGELILDQSEGSPQKFRVVGGYIDVALDKVTVLADSVEKSAGG